MHACDALVVCGDYSGLAMGRAVVGHEARCREPLVVAAARALYQIGRISHRLELTLSTL